MAKSEHIAPSSLEEKVANVTWTYFMLDEDGKTPIALDKKPTGIDIVAPLNTSIWPQGKRATPGLIKIVINRTLNYEIEGEDGQLRKPNICLALPCEPLAKMQEYYGADELKDRQGNKVEDCYVALRIHDDLKKGNDNFIDHGIRVDGTLPAETGASFIISAIKNGYHIWAYAGGNTIHPKLQLAEQYFARHPIDEAKDKSYFVGFSNGSTAQFYLRGVATPLHYYGVMWSIMGDDKEMTSLLFRTLEGENNLTHERIMTSENIEEIRIRHDEMMQEGDIVRNVTFFPHALGITCDSTFPKFKENEKIILGLEGYSQMPTGYNVHETLFRALDSGALNPDQILFISIEDIIQLKEQFEIPRRNGEIPAFEMLKNDEQKHIIDLAIQRGFYLEESISDIDTLTPGEKESRIKEAKIAAAKEYIAASNEITRNEIARVKEISAIFNIPVVEGGERRAGHAKQPIIQPSRVASLAFADDGNITQTSILCREKNERLTADIQKDPNHPVPVWPELDQKSIFESGEHQFITPIYEYVKNYADISVNVSGNEELSKAILAPLNNNAQIESLNGGEEDVVMGSALNILDLPIRNLENKGVVFHLPPRETITPASESHQIINSNHFKAAKFVIFSLEIPTDLDETKREAYLNNRNDIFQKLIKDYNIQKSVFITQSSTNHENLPPLFSASINLLKTPLPSPETTGNECKLGEENFKPPMPPQGRT